MPLVSVLLTSYNHEKYLRESIDSVLHQTFTDFELVILDDASTDHSWEIIQEYHDLRIVAIRRPTNQYYPLTEEVIGGLKGKYLAVHHSDDVWKPSKLEKQVKFMEEYPEYGACFTRVEFIDENGEFYELEDGNAYQKVFLQENRSREEWLNYFFYQGNCLCHPSILARVDLYKKYKLYDQIGMRQIPDFLRWVRLCLHKDIYIYPEVLVDFRLRRNGQENTSADSPSTHIRSQFELYYLLQEYNTVTDEAEFLKIFPSAKRFVVDGQINIKFALAKLAQEVNLSAYKLFSLNILYSLINNNVEADEIKLLYGYSYKDYMQETGDYDVFNIRQSLRTICTTVYFDYGNGYCDAHTKQVYVRKNGDFWAEFFIETKQRQLNKIRFDPDENHYVKVAIDMVSLDGKNVECVPLNAHHKEEEYDVFYTTDPQYEMYYDAGKLLIVKGNIDFSESLFVEAEEFKNTLINKCAALNNKCAALDSQCVDNECLIKKQQDMLNSRLYKICKKISNLFRSIGN